VDVSTEEVDFTIQTPAIPKPGVRYDTLFPIELLPVCSPAELSKKPSLREPRALLERTLLHSMKRPHDWQTWFEAAGVATGDLGEGLAFGNSSLAYQAAIDGLGVAIAHVEFVQDDLNTGRLVKAYPLVVRTADSYRLVSLEAQAVRPEVVAFRDWLLSEARIERTQNAAPASDGALEFRAAIRR
jgi:LysR family glycine cleavage system transcriptional activator